MAGMGGRRFTDIVVIGHMIRDRTNHVVSMIPNNQKNIMPIYFIGHNLADFDLVRARCRPENTLVLMLSDSNPSTNPMYQMVYDWLHKTAQGMAHNHILVLGPKSDEFLQFQKKADKIIECLELDIHMFLIELASSNMFVDSVMIGANSENHILAKRILQFVLWEIDINRNSSVRLNGMPGACQLLMHSMSDSDLIWDTVSNMDRPQILITNRDDRMLDAVSNLSDQTSLMLVSPNKSVAEFMGLFMAACDQIKNAISKLYPPKKPGKTYKISESVINNWVLKCLGENK